jgi:HipA-like protein
MKGSVYNNGILAGHLQKNEAGQYIFTYDDAYLTGNENPSISLTLPKTQKEYHSDELFSFFFGLLPEGVNKVIQCRQFKIDENDDWTLLLKTTGDATIGSITIKQLEE